MGIAPAPVLAPALVITAFQQKETNAGLY